MTRVSNPRKITACLALILLTACTRFQISDAFQSRPPLASSLLSKHPDVVAGVETHPFGRGTAKTSKSHSRSTTSLGAVPVASAVPSFGSRLVGTTFATLGNVLFPSSSSAATKTIRATALIVAGLFCVSRRLRHRVFWPGMTYPESEDSDLLPGSLGCPFMGSPWLYTSGDSSYGAGNYYRRVAKSLGAALGAVPKIWKYYILGKAFAVVSGGKTFQKVLKLEFDGSLTSSGVDLMEGGLMPTRSLLFEREKKRHSYLRKLVGAALTPSAVAMAAPTLQSAAEEQITKMLDDKEDTTPLVQFHQVCTDYTLDVAWRQILGLELTDEEIPVFEENVATWISGIVSLKVVLKIGVESSPGYAAREYVVSKIEEKIDQLLESGPDHQSTLSGMVFATDDDEDGVSSGKKLSRQEIIDNALILIFAGSETSASTLTNAMLFLSLHPSVWNQLVEEQRIVEEKHGDSLTISSLDANNAPYLDAVLKETMRMRTVVGGIPRMALKDIDVDGDGTTIIPKGFLIDPSMMLTHEEDPSTKLPNAMHMDAIQGFRPQRWLDTSSDIEGEDHPRPNPEWYVPYGFGPRYCLGKNLAQLEMKIFLATAARKLDFPKLAMLPEGYDYSPNKKDPSDPDYFSVEWKKLGAVIPSAGDGVLATVQRATPKTQTQPQEAASIPVSI